jgi:hypothetical protein
MAFTEEVFKNKGKLYGAQTGKEYAKSETSDFGAGGVWSKPCHYSPNSIVLEVESEDEPHAEKEKE